MVVPHLTLAAMTCFLAFVCEHEVDSPPAREERGSVCQDRWCVRFISRDITQELWISPWLHVPNVWTCM